MNLYDGILAGNKRNIARLISLMEEGHEEGLKIYEKLYPKTGRAKIIGITGPPGAGKSTLLGLVAKEYLDKGKSVGIVAVDPSSPNSGGAVLGDRVRMRNVSGNEKCFVRSMATRGQLGGVSRGAFDAVNILDACGYEYIFIETVGTGQSEVDIKKLADIVILVMVPGLGDDIQAIKAGIMEIGDLIVINKADNPEAVNTYNYIKSMISLKVENNQEILFTDCINKKGIEELIENIEKILNYNMNNNEVCRRKRINLIDELKENLTSMVFNRTLNLKNFKDIQNKVEKRDITPYMGASLLFKYLCNQEGENDI